MVCHIQAASSIKVGRCVLRKDSFCRSPSRCGTGSRASAATGVVSICVLPLCRPEVVPSAVGPMMKTALLILVIELADRLGAVNVSALEPGGAVSRRGGSHQSMSGCGPISRERAEQAILAERGLGVPERRAGLRRGLASASREGGSVSQGFGGRSPPDERGFDVEHLRSCR